MSDLTLWSSRPVARGTDPATSWEAAASVDPDKVRRSQKLILEILQAFGPMTDAGIWECIRRGGYEHLTSPSGARTRRAELVSLGLVRDDGSREIGPSGRRMIVWRARR